MNLLLNNWDFKTSNNRLYSVPRGSAGPARWFVVQDIGASLGGTAWPIGTRNDIERFEAQQFVAAADGELTFDYRGRHREIFETGDCRRRDLGVPSARSDYATGSGWTFSGRPHIRTAVCRRYRAHLAAKIAEGLALAGESEVKP